MKKLVYIFLLLVSTLAFSQSNPITYQAVIYLPNGQNAPGVNVSNVPMTNKNICLQFSFIDANNRVEYQEEVKVKTDEFGMVNITIGNGEQSGGYASSFDAIVWNASMQKNLQVALDARGLCNQFEILSNEPIASVPFANAAITAGNVSGVVALANGGTGATTAAGARTNLGIGNVDNTSDLNKPISTATKTYVDTAVTRATIVDADAATKGKIQLAGDLAGTAAAPTVPGLALKEDASNKSTTTTLGTSDSLYPSQKAVKTYVDTAIAGATIVDADATTKGKIQLAGDLAGTAAAPTVPGLALKEDASNKSTTTTLGTSDSLYPSQKAVKTYVDTAIAGATIVDADATTKGKIQLAGDLAGTAAAPTVPGLALKEDASNKSTTTTLGTSDSLYPSQKAVKTYVDTAIAGATIVDADATTKGKIQLAGDLAGTAAAPTVPGLALKEDASNKSTTTTLGTSDSLYPSQKAVKTYVDTAIAGATIVDADATTKGKIQLAGDLAGTAAAPTVPGLALKEDASNKSTTTTLGTSDSLYPTQKAVKTYADAKVVDGIADTVTTSAPTQNAVFDALVLKANATDVTTSLALKANTTDVTSSLALKEDAANKTVSVTTDGASDVKFPSAKAVKTYVDTAVSGSTTSVPYTGAIAAVNLGAYDLTVNGVKVGLGSGQVASNTVLGNSALDNNTSGANSVAVGNAALKSSTTANSNTAIGNGAMEATTSGGGNVAIGMSAMSKNTIGQQNTAIGQSALYNNTDASANTAIGNSAGASITTGGYNTIIGNDAAGGLTTGSRNTIIGRNVYSGNVSDNIIIGNGQGQIKAQHDGTSWTLGTIGSGVWNGTEIAIANGGTGATTATDALTNLGAQSSANLSTNLTTDAASTTKYPAVKTIKDYVDSSVSSGAPDATASLSGKIQLAGDLTGSAASPEVAIGAITEGKLAADAVTSAKIKDGEIVNADVSSTAAIAYSKLDLASSIVAADIATDAVETAKIKNAAVETAKLADGSVTTVKLATDAVTTLKITDANVTAAKLASDAVETAKIKDLNVTTGKLAADAVTTAKITDANITYAKIQNVSATDKVLGRVSTGAGVVEEIATTGSGDVVRATSPSLVTPVLGAATGTSLSVSGQLTSTVATGTAPLVVTSTTPVANLSIGGNAATVTTNADLTGDVTSSGNATTIGANKVVTGMIADGTIVVGDLADNAVETAKIKNLNVTTDKLAANAVTTAKITDANITYAKIQNVSATDKVLGRVSTGAGVVEEIATTGSGDVVRATSPTLVTPVLGAATGTSLSVSGQLTSTVTTGTAPLVVTSTTPVANLSIGGNAATVTTNANLTGDVTSSGNATTIATDAVTSTKILDGTIANADVSSTAAIAYSKLNLASSIVASDLANNAVETNKIKDAAVEEAKIKDAAVTYAKIQNVSATDKVLGRVSTGAGLVEEIATTGSGNVVRATSPTLVTPVLGAATGTSLSVSGQLTSTVATGTAPLVVTSTTPVANLSIGGNAATVTTNANLTGDVTSSGNATTIGANKVVTGMIVDGTIVVGDLADNAVEEAKIKDSAVTSAKIKDGEIVNADLSASAAIADTKLATIATAGKVSNSATTATDANTASAIVSRDANGNFTAGTITANLTGLASKATNLNGGSLGDIAYQSAANTSSFLSGNTSATKKFLTQTGTGSAAVAPAWGTVGTADITDLGANVATFLATPSSVNLFNAMTNKTGTGSLVFNTSPTLFSPILGIASATSIAFSGATSGTATIAAPAVAGTTTITLPGATGTLATLAGTETLTNKTLTSPNIGDATATSINKVILTEPTTRATLTIANGKTLTVNNTIFLAGTDDKTMTFPTTDATIARTDAAQTFTGVQTFSSDMVVNSVNIGRGKGAVATNTAVGKDAISATATGTDNTALGYNTLKAITSGSGNTTVGSQAALAMTTGTNNTVFGNSALSTVTSSQSNTAIGNDALKLLGDSTNDRNTAVGTGSFANLTTGQYNVGVGMGSLLNAGSGSNNVAVGKYAGFRDTNNNGVSSSNQSVFIGAETKPLNATSTNEIVIGYDARGLGNNSTVLGNSLITQAKIFGALDLPDTTTSTSTTSGALKVGGGVGIVENLNVGGNAKITGTLSIAGGTPGAGKVLTSTDNTGIASWVAPTGVTTMAAIGSTPNANGATISGVNLNLEPASASYGGIVTTGAQTFAGAKTFSPTLTAAADGETLVGLDINPTFTNGSYASLTNYGLRVQGIGFGRGGGAVETNTAIGSGVLIRNSTGANNTGLGYRALLSNTTGSGNTAFGSFAGAYIAATGSGGNASGTNSTFIGYNTSPLTDGDDNEVVIAGGNATTRTVGLGSNTTLIGNAATTLTALKGDVAIGSTTDGGDYKLQVTGNTKLTGTLTVTSGAGAGKVLTSDANGLATWTNASGSAVTTSIASYQITLAESIVFYTGSAAGTFAIPDPAITNAGKEITIKNKTAFGITITPTSTGKIYIDNANTAVNSVSIGIEASNNWIKLVSDGSQWNVLRALF